MNNELISAILLGLVAFSAGTVCAYWHLATRGTWRDWPAGRSLMGLLGIITVGFGYGVVNRFLGAYPSKYAVAVLLYALFIGAIWVIGFTIRHELRRGHTKTQHPSNHCSPATGSIDLPVATDKEPFDD